ncbi:MAG: hypothetical protein JRJ03_14330 [Deltaproteobacteria bacterium]|nr:hypothetical protein [Deltaproteobacteria bacterium]
MPAEKDRGGDGSHRRDQSKALPEIIKALEELLIHVEDLVSSKKDELVKSQN